MTGVSGFQRPGAFRHRRGDDRRGRSIIHAKRDLKTASACPTAVPSIVASRPGPNGCPARFFAVRHAVGEQAQPVARKQFDDVFLVHGIGFDAEQQAATLERPDAAGLGVEM